MAKRFEDLDVWKRSARLSADLYKALSTCKDYGYRDPDNTIQLIDTEQYCRRF
jgi:hypothetical protein